MRLCMSVCNQTVMTAKFKWNLICCSLKNSVAECDIFLKYFRHQYAVSV